MGDSLEYLRSIMRIVCCNKYFFLNGGTERYLRNILDALPLRGHETVPFSIAYAGSWESEWSRFFLPPPGPADASHYKDIRLTPSSALTYAERSIYSFAARRSLSRLLECLEAAGGTDIGYLLNIYNYMSPSIVHSFQRRNIPVVIRFGDYHPLCASYTFLREARPCTLCATGAFYHGLRHRCVKGSWAASALRVLSMYIQRWLRLYRSASAFVAPCDFMRSMLEKGGFPAERIHVIRQPAFPTMPGESVETPAKRNRIVFFGRISREKGIDTLIDAYQELAPPVELHIAGRSYDGCVEELRQRIRPDMRQRIVFHGFLQGTELSRLVAESLLSICPSRWYDNAPLSIYESYLLGTPVLASNIGGIPEQVTPGATGELFQPGDAHDLAVKLQDMLAVPQRLEAMGRAARDYARTSLSLDSHLDKLLDLFHSLATTRRKGS